MLQSLRKHCVPPRIKKNPFVQKTMSKDKNKEPRKTTIVWKSPLANADLPPHPPKQDIMALRQNYRPIPDVAKDKLGFRKWLMHQSNFTLTDVKEAFRAW